MLVPLSLLLVPTACRRATPPSLLLITLDTTRADVLSAYGSPVPTSPALEGLARQGIRFDGAYTPVNFTTPAHATLFTSQAPLEHGVRANVGDGYRLPPSAFTLAERLRDAGFATGAFVGAYTAGSESGLGQGFDTFHEPDYTHGSERTAIDVVDDALRWLDQQPPARPVLLWVHLFDPHGPYAPPAAFAELLGSRLPPSVTVDPMSPQAADVRRYQAEIRYADTQLARAVAAMRARGPTVVSVVGDHGETLVERPCGFYHGHNLFEEQMRVPWLMAGPGLPAGRQVRTPVPTLDVAPTLLAALGIETPASFTGRNLLPALRDGEEPAASPLWLESGMCDPRRCSDCFPVGISGKLTGVRAGRFKLVRTPIANGVRLELFDLEADPGEVRDIASQYPNKVNALSSSLSAHFGAAPDRVPEADAAARARLRALGYTP